MMALVPRWSVLSVTSAAGLNVMPSAEVRIRWAPSAAPWAWPQLLVGSGTNWSTSMVCGSAIVIAAGSPAVWAATVADQPVARSLSTAAALPQPAGAADSSVAGAGAPPAGAGPARGRGPLGGPAAAGRGGPPAAG